MDCFSKMDLLGRKGIPFLFVLDYDLKKTLVEPLDNIDKDEILFKIRTLTNSTHKENKAIPLKSSPESYSLYKERFNTVQEELIKGNSYLVNLTSKTPVTFKGTLKDIYETAAAPYKLYIKDRCVLFSPECFVRISGGKISSFPMKGTIDARKHNARKQILENEKEFAEHITIVDLIRNDLSRIASHVIVEEFRYIDHVKTNHKDLLQVSSRITGTLPDDYTQRIGSLFSELLPAGSITGAPKRKTCEIISKAENVPRNDYCGVFGYFDGKDLDSAVMIRLIEKEKQQYYYRSGGGITIYSCCEDEYQEMKDKIYVPVY